MSLTLEEVKKVALLARLQLSDDELAKMQVQLSQILDHINMLAEVDVTDVPPTAQVTDLLTIMRADEVQPSLTIEQVLANAPDQADSLFRVKAVFDDEAQ